MELPSKEACADGIIHEWCAILVGLMVGRVRLDAINDDRRQCQNYERTVAAHHSIYAFLALPRFMSKRFGLNNQHKDKR